MLLSHAAVERLFHVRCAYLVSSDSNDGDQFGHDYVQLNTDCKKVKNNDYGSLCSQIYIPSHVAMQHEISDP